MSELTLSPEQQVEAAPASPTAAGLADRLRAFAGQPAVAKMLPTLGLMAVVAASIGLWLTLREPPQRDLFRGLPETEQAAIAAALDGANIAYAFDAATGSLTVSENDYHSAKLSLASQGLPKSAPDGDALISDMPMGVSRAVEGEKLRTARQLDLARTIEAMDAVVTARVHLAVEAPSVFIRDRSEPSASVMLTLAGGTTLGEAQVQSIVRLVASSVSSLSPDAVSVVDQNGQLLSGNGGDALSDRAARQLGVQTQLEERYRRTLVSLLTPMLGADNFTAQVNAEMDFAERQATRESFPEGEARVAAEEGSWSNDKGEGPSYGIPGALANRPPADTRLTDEFPGDDTGEEQVEGRTSENFTRRFELGREVSVTRDAPGSLRRLSVAVALRSPVGKKQRSAEELAAVEALVKGAIGFKAERGDTVAIKARAFQDVEAPLENWWDASWVSPLARNLSAVLVALILLFGIGRPLMNKLRKSDAAPADAQQIAGEIEGELVHHAQAAPAGPPVSLDMIGAAASYAERAALIQDFVRQNPDHAAMVVRELMDGTAPSAAPSPLSSKVPENA